MTIYPNDLDDIDDDLDDFLDDGWDDPYFEEEEDFDALADYKSDTKAFVSKKTDTYDWDYDPNDYPYGFNADY